MVTLSCTASRENGVTLVTGRVENPGETRRVRITSRLDGPLWPPRRQGRPADGWDDEGFECVLAADEVRPLGVASPAPPADPPLAVAEAEPVDADDGVEPRVAVPTVESTADGVVRALGSPRPPRDAVPTPDVDGGGGDTSPPEPADAEPTTSGSDDPETGVAVADASSGETSAGPDGVSATRDETGTRSDDDLAATLDAVATRIETADRLSATTRVPEATEALREVGGVAGVRDLDAQLSRDAERLSRLAERTSELAERAEAATVAVERLDQVR